MSAELFNTLVQSSPNATFVFNLDSNKFTFVNPAFKTLTGINSETPTLSDILSLIHEDDVHYLEDCFQRFQEEDMLQDIEFKILSNEEKHLRLTPILLPSESDRSLLCYLTDITAEMHSLHTMKKYANKKNSTLNILSHDLRGPLGIAITVTEVLTRKVNDPHLINLTETVSKILKQSIDMISDLTGREFLETSDIELSKKRIDIVQKLKEYMEEYQKSEYLSKRTFKFFSTSEKILMNIDESKFVQVMNNLATNALKFTHDNGTISLSIQEKPEAVLFVFSDDGIGIPKQFHVTLFEKFSDARRPGLNGEPTVGLGLPIVKTIVEWHKGKIWFDSKENEGTTFYVEIPKN